MTDSKKVRARLSSLVVEQKGKCAYCERPFGHAGGFRRPTLDHIVPMSAGGSRWDRTNLAAACTECNMAKGRTDAASFRKKLASNREQAVSLSLALRRSVEAIGA